MGQAKARGTFERRRELAIERERIEAEQREQLRLAAIRAKHEAVRNLPPEARKEILMRRESPKHTRMMIAAAAMALAIPTEKKR